MNSETEWPSVAVSADRDLPAIAAAAGAGGFVDRRYQDGRLYVRGVTQAALDAAAAQVVSPPAPPLPTLEGLQAQVTTLQAQIAALAAGGAP